MESISRVQAAKLRKLIHRKDKVLAVMHPPAVTYGRIMEMAGCVI